jgi:hypothetical protein
MLGEQIYEHKGKVVAQRVLDLDKEGGGREEGLLPKIETTFSADAKVKGTIDINEVGTYWSVVRPGGILYGEGQGLYTAKDDNG